MDKPIYGTWRIAVELNATERTVRRHRMPGGPLEFISVGSMSNLGGGHGRAAWTYTSSLDAARPLLEARRVAAGRAGAAARWDKPVAACGSGSLG